MELTTANQVACTLNGKAVSFEVDDELMLLNLLRDTFDIVSPKNGCQPMGQCGCCAVMVDGKVVLSCVVKAKTVAAGQSDRHHIGRSFHPRSATLLARGVRDDRWATMRFLYSRDCNAHEMDPGPESRDAT